MPYIPSLDYKILGYTDKVINLFIDAAIIYNKFYSIAFLYIFIKLSIDNIYYRSAEIGYYLGENYWNKGLATYAVKKACEYVFANSDIIRIFAEPFARNSASRRVLSKTGFVYEGTMFSSAIKNGIVEDTVIYGLLKGV